MSWVAGQQLPVTHSDGGLDGRVPHWVRGRTEGGRRQRVSLVLEHHPLGLYPEVHLGFGLRRPGLGEVLAFGPLVLELELKLRLPGLGTERRRLCRRASGEAPPLRRLLGADWQVLFESVARLRLELGFGPGFGLLAGLYLEG